MRGPARWRGTTTPATAIGHRPAAACMSATLISPCPGSTVQYWKLNYRFGHYWPHRQGLRVLPRRPGRLRQNLWQQRIRRRFRCAGGASKADTPRATSWPTCARTCRSSELLRRRRARRARLPGQHAGSARVHRRQHSRFQRHVPAARIIRSRSVARSRCSARREMYLPLPFLKDINTARVSCSSTSATSTRTTRPSTQRTACLRRRVAAMAGADRAADHQLCGAVPFVRRRPSLRRAHPVHLRQPVLRNQP